MDYICFEEAHLSLDISTLLSREVKVSAQERGVRLLETGRKRVVQNSRYSVFALADETIEVRERLNKENLTRIKKPLDVRELCLLEENDILIVLSKQSKVMMH